MERTDIRHQARMHLSALSGGQRRRGLLAQGLVQDHEILLLDEPATGLDLISIDTIRKTVQEEKQAGCTIVITSHDLADAWTADNVVLLAGRVISSGIPDDVLAGTLERHPDQLLGIKDSGGDAERTSRYMAQVPREGPGSGFRVMAGADSAHASLYGIGCVGGVSGLANAVPALVKTIQFAHREGGEPHRPQNQLNELHAILNAFPRVGALKQLIQITSGLPLTHTRPPYRDLDRHEVRALEEAVGRYLIGEAV